MTRVEMTTKREMDVHSLDDGGRAAIHLAVVSGFLYKVNYDRIVLDEKRKQMVQHMLDQGAQLEVKDVVLQWTPLEYAMASKSWDIVEFLLDETKPEYNLKLYEKHIKPVQSPLLHHAAAYGFIKLVNLHILVKDDVWAEDKRGATPLHATCSSVRGSLKVAKALVKSIGSDQVKVEHYLNKRDKKGNSALHFACKELHYDIVEFLISSGADVWTRNEKSALPLHMYFNPGSIHMVECFIRCLQERNISVEKFINSQVSNEYSLLHWSTASCCYEVTKLLITNGGNVWLTDDLGKTPLHLACEGYCLKCVDVIIESVGSNVKEYVNLTDKMGMSALHHASATNFDVGIVKKLILNGANILSAMNLLSETPLFVTSEFGSLEKAQALIDSFGDDVDGMRTYINVTNIEGMSALDVARNNNQGEIVTLLMSAGKKVVQLNDKKVSENREREIDGLQENDTVTSTLGSKQLSGQEGFNSHQPTDLGINFQFSDDLFDYLNEGEPSFKVADNLIPESNYLLHTACSFGELDLVKGLIMSYNGYETEISAYVNAPAPDMWTALQIACSQGHDDIVKYLLEQGADKEAYNIHQNNSLHISCIENKIECVHTLITSFNGHKRAIMEYVNLPSKDGLSAIHLACLHGHFEIVNILFNYGADRQARNMLNETPLHISCLNNRIECVRVLITSFNGNESSISRYLNLPGDNEITALHFACNQGHSEVVKLLIKHGANREAMDINKDNPLHFACFYNKIDCVKELIMSFNENKCAISRYVNLPGWKDMSPLHCVCRKGNLEIVKLLLDHGANREVKYLKQYNPLFISCIENNIECVQALITSFNGNKKAISDYVNLSGKDGFSALHLVCQMGHFEIVNLLIKYGADREAEDMQNDNPLQISCLSNEIECVRALFTSYNGNKSLISRYVNLPGKHKGSALHVACSRGYSEIVNLLIKHEADREAQDMQNYNPLHISCSSNKIDCVKALIASFNGNEVKICEYVNLLGWNNMSALHLACDKGYLEIVNLLLAHGADRETQTIRQNNPLHTCCVNNNIDCVKALIASFKEEESEINEYVNLPGERNLTALQYACRKGHMEIVNLLLECGAEREAKPKDLHNALHNACASNKIECVEAILASFKEDKTAINKYVNLPGQDQWTALLIACTEGNVKIVKLLLEHGANREAKNIKQYNPLHISCIENKIECVKTLMTSFSGNESAIIEYVNLPGKDGFSALHLVCQLGHFEIVNLLIKFGADREAKDMLNDNPLHISCLNNKIECVRELITSFNGIKSSISRYVNLPGEDGRCALHFASYQGHSEIVNLLIKLGANRAAKSMIDDNPLHTCCYNNKIDCVKVLIASFEGNEIEICDYVNLSGCNDMSALHLACDKGHLEIVNLLLTHGADREAKDMLNDNPLHTCCLNNKIDCVQILIESFNGEENKISKYVNLPGAHNSSALHFACQEGHLEIVNLLLKIGAKREAKDAYLNNSLHISCSSNKIECVEALIASFKEDKTKIREYINLSGQKEKSALHIACRLGYLDIVNLLLKHGANREEKNEVNDNTLHVSCSINKTE